MIKNIFFIIVGVNKMGVGPSYERASVPMRPVRVVEDTAMIGSDAVGMVEKAVSMVVVGRRSPRRKSAKKSPAKKSKKMKSWRGK